MPSRALPLIAMERLLGIRLNGSAWAVGDSPTDGECQEDTCRPCTSDSLARQRF